MSSRWPRGLSASTSSSWLFTFKQSRLVILLPVVDYASPDGDVDLYDEAWSQPEIAALESYVAQGGLLVLTNSAYRLRAGNWRMKDSNEDWPDANALAERFGVSYQAETLAPGSIAQIQSDHPLLSGIYPLCRL